MYCIISCIKYSQNIQQWRTDKWLGKERMVVHIKENYEGNVYDGEAIF
jgi:hypothetical protein